MTTITRRIPQSNIARLKSINTFKTAYDATPPGMITLPADTITALPLIHTEYNTNYYAADEKEAALALAIGLKNTEATKLNVTVNHFLQVMRLTVIRSLLLEDGKWEKNDIVYYNLDETGGNLPDINNDEDILVWANHVINGETNRKAAKPLAPDMVNPAVADVTALVGPFNTGIGNVVAATVALTSARSHLNDTNTNADKFILSVWNFLDANLSGFDDSARRNVLRQYGVVFISTGIPNIIKGHVKNPGGLFLEGAVATIQQTGAAATSNADGLFEISSTALGNLDVQVTFPGLSKKTISLTVPDDAEEQTFDLGIIEMTV